MPIRYSRAPAARPLAKEPVEPRRCSWPGCHDATIRPPVACCASLRLGLVVLLFHRGAGRGVGRRRPGRRRLRRRHNDRPRPGECSAQNTPCGHRRTREGPRARRQSPREALCGNELSTDLGLTRTTTRTPRQGTRRACYERGLDIDESKSLFGLLANGHGDYRFRYFERSFTTADLRWIRAEVGKIAVVVTAEINKERQAAEQEARDANQVLIEVAAKIVVSVPTGPSE